MGFEELRQSYFHHVSCGPFEQKPPGLSYSDIVLHLPVLEYYASQCDHVVEFGVREAFSTVAFLSGCRTLVESYDIDESAAVRALRNMKLPCEWKFHLGSTTDPKTVVPECDLMFFDTLHTYEQLSLELQLHARKARRYLAFHDTHTCWHQDRTGADPRATGIGPAIEEFLEDFQDEYKTAFETHWSNGLLILERVV